MRREGPEVFIAGVEGLIEVEVKVIMVAGVEGAEAIKT